MKSQAPEAPALLTIPQVADLLQLSRSQVYQMAASRELPTVRIGRSVRVHRERLDAWLDQRSR